MADTAPHAVDLRQPIDEALVVFRSEVVCPSGATGGPVRGAVPAEVAQAKVRGEVDDVSRHAPKLSDAALGLAVGQGEEEHVTRLQLGEGGEADRLAACEAGASPSGAEVGVQAVDELTGVRFRRNLRDGDAGVGGEEAQQLAAAVA